MSVNALEYHHDIAGGRNYASRNYGHVQHVYKAATCNAANLEFCNTLRQVRPNQLKPMRTMTISQSMPELRTAAREVSSRAPLVAEHEEGPYLATSGSVAKYQNFGQTKHLVSKTSLRPTELDWMLNLRGSIHAEDPSAKWRRFHTRPQQSFDMMA